MYISTEDCLLPRHKASAWTQAYVGQLDSVDFVPADPQGFSAEMRVHQLGQLRLARLTSEPALIELEFESGSTQRDKMASIIFQMSGRSRLEQLGNEVGLAEGDASLFDNSAPYKLELLEASSLLVLRVPLKLLKEHLPSPEWFCGRLLRHNRGLNTAIIAMALTLFETGDAELSEAHEKRMAQHLLDLVATSYAIAFDTQAAHSSVISGRQASIKLYIEQHLRDPDLSPCSIAAQLKLSSRYLRVIFAVGNETVSAYILRRRLEECAKQIADQRWRGHSMTEIAFSWGFNSASHFTRSFRDRFGLAPRDYRRTNLAETATSTAA